MNRAPSPFDELTASRAKSRDGGVPVTDQRKNTRFLALGLPFVALVVIVAMAVGHAQDRGAAAPAGPAGQARGGRGQGPATPPAPRDVPARTIPIPDTVSPEMQALIGRGIGANWNVAPKTDE